jgi:hypothetical protein
MHTHVSCTHAHAKIQNIPIFCRSHEYHIRITYVYTEHIFSITHTYSCIPLRHLLNNTHTPYSQVTEVSRKQGYSIEKFYVTPDRTSEFRGLRKLLEHLTKQDMSLEDIYAEASRVEKSSQAVPVRADDASADDVQAGRNYMHDKNQGRTDALNRDGQDERGSPVTGCTDSTARSSTDSPGKSSTDSPSKSSTDVSVSSSYVGEAGAHCGNSVQDVTSHTGTWSIPGWGDSYAQPKANIFSSMTGLGKIQV